MNTENVKQQCGKTGSKKLFILLFVILAAQILVCMYFGVRKKGFHEDEYYSYYSTNRSLGLYEPDRAFQDASVIRNEFTVLPGEQFQYARVAEAQSWDVHPPLYYDILHTVCSLTPGIFSKWQGIAVNLAAFILSFFLLYRLTCELQENRAVSVITVLLWGFHPMTVSFVMFIRMYMWLTVFVLLCALLHVRMLKALRAGETGGKIYILRRIVPIMICSFLGFLTQYYYVIFFFFCGIGMLFWMLKHRMFRTAAVYCISCIASLVLAAAAFPACISQILHGYRGTEAMSAFVSSANIGERFSFFFGMLNQYVFAGMFWILAAAILIGLLVFRIRPRAEIKLMLLAAAGYFLVILKTSLLLGATSNRYAMPVYGIMIFLSVYAVFSVIRAAEKRFAENSLRRSPAAGSVKNGVQCNACFREEPLRRAASWARIFFALLAAAALLLDFKGLFADGYVLFLYPEEEQKISYDRAHADETVIVMYNPATPMNVWRLTDELLVYPREYFMNASNTDPVSDKEICNSKKILIYAADCDTIDKEIENVLECNKYLSSFKTVRRSDMWTLYELE